jgi:hypothetical protein
MAKFLSGSALNAALEKILDTAQERLILISPYIKLHNRVKSALTAHQKNPSLEIVVVFGKNEDNVSKSMSRSEVDFFCDFPNIKVLYAEHLHAKYYANELDALITSMNLYEYSQNQNIEAGILMEYKILGSNSLDYDASDFFQRVIDQAKIVFQSVPEFEKTNLGFSKKYIKSNIQTDNREAMFGDKKAIKDVAPSSTAANANKATKMGFCIRTGASIPFNPKRPMSDEAHKSWSKFSNPDYAEKFCHFSGEPSNGETTFAKPILRKNWNKAKEVHGM